MCVCVPQVANVTSSVLLYILLLLLIGSIGGELGWLWLFSAVLQHMPC